MDPCKYTCDDQQVPRPPTGKTPVRNLRVADEVWRPALSKARGEGKTLTEIIVAFLRDYVAGEPAQHTSGTHEDGDD